MAAGGIEPGHADAVAFLHVRDAGAHGDDMTDALMARDEGRLRLDRPVAVDRVQVRVADAARRDLDEDLTGARVGTGTSSIASGFRIRARLPPSWSFVMETSRISVRTASHAIDPRSSANLNASSTSQLLIAPAGGTPPLASISLAIESINSSADANSCCRPVTTFSTRPASALRSASLRTFNTYVRRLRYLDSGLRGMAKAGPDTREQRRRVGSPSGQRTVIVWSELRES